MGIPAYRVLTNATIERIADMMPTDSEQLEAVSGIGAATMEQYGYDILQLVQQIAQGSSESTEEPPSAASKDQESKSRRKSWKISASIRQQNLDADRHQPFYWTWRLFTEGYSAAQIAQIRRCDPRTLLEELQAASDFGLEVRPDWGLAVREFTGTKPAQPTSE